LTVKSFNSGYRQGVKFLAVYRSHKKQHKKIDKQRKMDKQTKTDKDRHRQRQTDGDRQRQT
jgi:hypothetical protein